MRKYTSKEECLKLLLQLDPDDADRAQAELTDMAIALNAGTLPQDQCLEVLESARPMLAAAQENLAKSYVQTAVIPKTEGNRLLKRVLNLWKLLYGCYTVASRAPLSSSSKDVRTQIGQRRMHALCQIILEHFRAHRALPPEIWLNAHQYYAGLERAGLAHIRVPEPLNAFWKAQSSLETYLALLLVDAANPYGRSEEEFHLILQWANRFAPYCMLHDRVEAPKTAGYSLDLSVDEGLRPLGANAVMTGPDIRYFDGRKLGEHIREAVTQIKRGKSTSALGLGENDAKDAVRLLRSLYRPWGLAEASKRSPRYRGRGGVVGVCDNWSAIGFCIQGKTFEQPKSAVEISAYQHDMTMLTLGERVNMATTTTKVPDDATESQRIRAKQNMVAEQWEVINQSASGIRIRIHQSFAQLRCNQLVGLRPEDSDRFLLGYISWLMYDSDYLEVAVHLLPGLPQVVAVQPESLTIEKQPFQQAFLLPASPTLQTDASLILSPDWFRENRVIQFNDYKSDTQQVRLDKLQFRGSNFVRVAFEQVEPLTPSDIS